MLTDCVDKPSRVLPVQAGPQSEKVYSAGEITAEHFSAIGVSRKKASALDDGPPAPTRIHRNLA